MEAVVQPVNVPNRDPVGNRTPRKQVSETTTRILTESRRPCHQVRPYGIYNINIFHLTPKIDLNSRAEWFDDVRGTRTGVSTNYSEVTLGINWHPLKYIEFRPEIRGDFAGAPAFGVDGAHTHRSQLSGGISFLLKF